MENLYSEFLWWVGVVEDRMDPLMLGRCRVRIVGYHTSDTTKLPTADLPWAYPLQPITSAAISGIGSTPLGPLEGTWVMGFFRDGSECQEPVMMGTMGGFPQKSYVEKIQNTSNYGFQDPNKNFPLKESLDEPDTNRLARNQKIDETIVGKKRNNKLSGIETAMGGETWDEPDPPFGPRYPHNHVTFTESGHAIELDDTPGAERIHVYHNKGTYLEVDGNGTMTRRIVGNDYHIVECNGYISIQGKANVTVEGDCNVYVKGNCNMEVDGKLKTHVHGDYELNVAGKIDLVAGKDIILNSGTNMKLEAATKTSLTSPIVEGNLFQGAFKGSISITPPQPVPYSAASPVGEREPQNPEITTPGLKLTPEERALALEEAEAARALGTPDSLEFAAARQQEADTGVRSSSTAPAAPNVTATCEVAQKVIDEAKKYVGMIETGARQRALNKGGAINPVRELSGDEKGVIDEMLRLTGLDNAVRIRETGGEGYHWCAAFVNWCWKKAGVNTAGLSGAAGCDNWKEWGKKKGLYSDTPALGAAVLYFSNTNYNDAHHIGIVVGLNPLTTIEGNTNLVPSPFSRNGAGCFVRTPPASSANLRKYIHLPGTCRDVAPSGTESPPAATVIPDSTCISPELKTYLTKLQTAPVIGGKRIPASVLDQLPGVICQFKIDTPTKIAHFLSQCAHESGNFRYPRELGGPEYLKKYEGRKDLGNTQPGDGIKYAGRGYIQLTGRANYTAFDKFVPEDIVENPDLVATKYPLLSAAWFWTKAKPRINQIADSNTNETVREITRLVNGRYNGLEDRQNKFNSLIALV